MTPTPSKGIAHIHTLLLFAMRAAAARMKAEEFEIPAIIDDWLVGVGYEGEGCLNRLKRREVRSIQEAVKDWLSDEETELILRESVKLKELAQQQKKSQIAAARLRLAPVLPADGGSE